MKPGGATNRETGIRRRSFLGSIASAAWVVGCIDLAPRYRRSPPPVPPNFPAGGVYPAAPASELAAPAWRDFFSDPKLLRLIDLALRENRDLRAAAAQITQARARYQVQRAALFPNVTAQAGASFLSEPNSVAAGTSTLAGSFNERLYSLTGGVASYELDLFGKVRDLTRAARDQYLATKAGRDALQITLVASIANQYLTLSADQALIVVAEETLASGEDSVAVTRQRFNSGIDDELALSQAETIVQQARYQIERLRTQFAQDRDALDLLVGATVSDDLIPGADIHDVAVLEQLPQAVRSTVLLTRPDVIQAEDQLRATNADIGAARAAFFPSIVLTGSGGVESLALANLFRGSSGTWSFDPSISQTIFDAGALRGNLLLAKAQRDQALAQYEKAVQAAFRDVADALAVRGTIDRQLDAQQRLVAANQTAERIARARYESGSDTYLNWLITQRSLFVAQQSLVSVELLRVQNLVSLYAALGGGLDTAA
ncbi:MAG TPA: efflux transporter outer membrane subunit [Caulobacteraceae bacterium]|jgi:multidrug efflux system outer membrane protein|nr:efflux transporter outer membrane subunit [Caulobacteraceae bacterium]